MAYTFRVAARNDIGMRYHCRIICMDLGCFHTSTFGAHPGSIDVRVRFVWIIWTLFSKIINAPVNHTQVRIKMVVWGTVHVKSGIVRCWYESNCTKLWKWTAIYDVWFDKTVCLCVFLLTFLTRLTDALQAERRIISFLLASVFFRTFAVHLRQIDSCAVMCSLWKQNHKFNNQS